MDVKNGERPEAGTILGDWEAVMAQLQKVFGPMLGVDLSPLMAVPAPAASRWEIFCGDLREWTRRLAYNVLLLPASIVRGVRDALEDL